MNVHCDAHYWHMPPSPTCSSGIPNSVMIPLIALSVFFVATLVTGVIRCMRKAQISTYDDNDFESWMTLGDDVTLADEYPKTVVVHRDASRVPRMVKATPVELPPPYTSISLV